jgi:hypothetical protein
VYLSHCWGDVQPLKTTRETIASHQNSITWTDLPKTFQDAIIFTRCLGLKYLWIDSLCICQDEPEDWARESSAMRKVYEQCYLTIAATSATNAHYGLFTQRARKLVRISAMTPAGIPVRIRGDTTFTHPEKIYHDIDWRRWPLFKRAWAFQERILSPWVLHFTSEELLWECQEDTSCECGHIEPLDKAIFHHAKEKPTHKTPVSQWHHTVQVYSVLQMSDDADKLPAISGLARSMEDRRNGAQRTSIDWMLCSRTLVSRDIHANGLT